VDFAVAEERLQPIVCRSGEEHAPQDFEAFIRGQRGAQRGTAQAAIARVQDFFDGLLKTLIRGHTGGGLRHIDRGEALQAHAELAREGAAQRIDRGLSSCRGTAGGGQCLAGRHTRKWVSLEDERTKFPPQRVGIRVRPMHAAHGIAVRRRRRRC
jgi:hypothetical protein